MLTFSCIHYKTNTYKKLIMLIMIIIKSIWDKPKKDIFTFLCFFKFLSSYFSFFSIVILFPSCIFFLLPAFRRHVLAFCLFFIRKMDRVEWVLLQSISAFLAGKTAVWPVKWRKERERESHQDRLPTHASNLLIELGL